VNQSAWIVCEHSGRWAAALRVTFSRQTTPSAIAPKLYEVRSLVELAARLEERPTSIGLLEVRSGNVGEVLEWLLNAKRTFPRACFAALLDSSLTRRQPIAPTLADDRQLVIDALWEAGATEVAESPRYLHGILEVGRRHSERCSEFASAYAESQPIADWAWAALPWQDPQSRLG